MNIQTRELGAHERAVCTHCSWTNTGHHAAAHVAVFPTHRVLVITTEQHLVFAAPEPEEANA